MTRVSVVVPTYNRLARLQQMLAGLARQTYPRERFEVVVISDGSTDGTDDYLRSLRGPLNLRPVFQPNGGAAAARNVGVETAAGELILFIDDDVVPSPRLLAEHIRLHDESSADTAVLGPMLSPPDFQMSPWVHWEQYALAKQYQRMVSGRWPATARQFYTGNTSVPKRCLIEAGGFDPVFRRAEDVELAYRLAERGLCFVFNPRAIGWHYAERSFDSWLQTAYAYGRNDVVFSRERGHSWLLSAIFEEFNFRSPLVRWMAWTCLDSRVRRRLAVDSLRLVVQALPRPWGATVHRLACSGMFNLEYYQGVADALGGRRAFYAELARAAATADAA